MTTSEPVLTVVDMDRCCSAREDGSPDPSVMWQVQGPMFARPDSVPAEIVYGVAPEGARTLVPAQPLVRDGKTRYWFRLRVYEPERGRYCSAEAEATLEE